MSEFPLKQAAAGVVLLMAMGATACDDHPAIGLDVRNHTGSALSWCHTRQGSTQIGEQYCDELPSRDEQAWGLLCHRGARDGMRESMRVEVFLDDTAEVIYDRVATCDEWDGKTLTIQEDGDGFLVTDGLQSR